MSKILVIGSLNMDLVLDVQKMPKIGETVTGSNITYLVGGKGANQAVCCSRLSNEVKLVGKIGHDAFGEKIAMKMKSENVNIEHVQISKSSPSGVATITKSPEDNSIIVIPGANSLVDPEDIQKRESLISESDILLSQLEIPLQTVNAAMKLAKKNGVLTVLNPAPYQTMDDEFLSYVDFITPNETEFLSMFSNMHTDTHVSLEEAMLVWQSKHKTRLIVTLGSNGCAYVENESVIKIPAYQVKVVDTTGAGDTFNGALAHCLAQSKDLNHSLRFAVKAGSLSVEQFGAQSGMPTLDQLQ